MHLQLRNAWLGHGVPPGNPQEPGWEAELSLLHVAAGNPNKRQRALHDVWQGEHALCSAPYFFLCVWHS